MIIHDKDCIDSIIKGNQPDRVLRSFGDEFW